MNIPLAESLRPSHLDEVVGQSHLVGEQGWLRLSIKSGRPLSILFWGPPGCGKTTLARLYAKAFSKDFVSFSPIFQGVADLKKVVKEAKEHPLFQSNLLLFVDEIHRFNRAQQDAFLPFVEDGTITLVGATTENPSFALNAALLSRLRVLILNPLTSEDLYGVITRYEKHFNPLPLTSEAKDALVAWSAGDARHLLNMLEQIKMVPVSSNLNREELAHFVQRRQALHDKAGEGHYNLISALHKSVRGSDPDAALYWLYRLFEGGEDRQFLGRRIVRMATEDIGLADPAALGIALDAWRAYDQLGSPEGELALAQAIVYLALSPKSNSIYTASKEAMRLAKNSGHLPPPKVILNAPTALMKDLGYGKDYLYDHNEADGFSGQNYFPDNMERASFYHPVERGFERELKKRLLYFEKKRSVKS